MQPGRNQTGDVGHVHHQQGADAVGDGAQAREVEETRVGAGAGHDQLGLVFLGQTFHLVVVDLFRLRVDAVVVEVVELARTVEPESVAQMAAVIQLEGQHAVARLEQGQIDRFIGLCAGMGLHIGVVGPEQRLDPLSGDLLGHVHKLAAAIVAPAGIAFCIFVGEDAAHGRQHGA